MITAAAVLMLIAVLQLNRIEDRLLTLQSGGTLRVAPPKKRAQEEIVFDETNLLKQDTYDISAPDASYNSTITRWYGPDPKGFNPLTDNAADLSDYIQAYVNDWLGDYQFKDPNYWKPELATRIEVTDDYKEYTIYLRKGVMWHKPAVDWSNPRYDWLEGEHEFTAEDVKFTLDLILNPQVEAAHIRNYYKEVESYEIIDKYKLKIRWSKKTFNSLSYTIELMPIPKFLYAYNEDGEPFPEESMGLQFNEHWYNQKAIGTGPYRFVSKTQGVSIELERNENYWGDKPPIKQITYLIFPEPKTNIFRFKSGELSFARLTPSDYREEILNAAPDSPFKTGSIKHDFYDQTVYYYIGWNLDSPLFGDKSVRRAMTMFLDRERILKNIFMGLGTVATGPFYYKSPYNDGSIEPIPYNPEQARRLIHSAGWEDTDGDGIIDKKINGRKVPFKFTFLLYAGSPEWDAMTALYKEELFKAGINMDISRVEWSVMQKRMDDRDFDCYSGGWGLVWYPDPYQIWHSSQADLPKSSNRIGFRNGEADQIIEELRETFDREKRIKLCHRFHQLIHDLQPYTFFYSRKRVVAWWADLRGIDFRPVRPQTFSLPWYFRAQP